MTETTELGLTISLSKTTLQECVMAANACAAEMETAKQQVLNSARRHLMLSLSLGAVIQRAYTHAAAVQGAQVTGLFSDNTPNAATLAAVEGLRFSFTYATGAKYRKLYQAACRALQERGAEGMTKEELQSTIAAHSARLICGAYEDGAAATEDLFGTLITADNMRQAMLELLPGKHAADPREVLRAELAAAQDARTEEERRMNACRAWGSVPTRVRAYIDTEARWLTPTERKSYAQELRDMARELEDWKAPARLPL